MYNLRNYPWDEQTAIMQIASYGFQKHDIEYVWKETDPVQINKVTVWKPYLKLTSLVNPSLVMFTWIFGLLFPMTQFVHRLVGHWLLPLF